MLADANVPGIPESSLRLVGRFRLATVILFLVAVAAAGWLGRAAAPSTAAAPTAVAAAA
jgi:hypothetical protein